MIQSTNSTISKPDTSSESRIAASQITVADLVSASMTYNPDDTSPFVQFIEENTGREFSLRSDMPAYKLVKTGYENKHPYLRASYIANTYFRFLMRYREEAVKGKKKVKVLTGVHAYPTREFAGCDMAELLRQPVADDEIIVQVLSGGNLVVYTFPSDLYVSGINSFIAALEGRTELSVGDTLKTTAATYTLNAVIGSTLHFSGFAVK